MVCMGEHIDGLHGIHTVKRIKKLEVARLGGRVATDIDHTLGSGIEDYLHHIGVHTRTWGVGDDDVRPSVLFYKGIGKDVLHIAGIEEGLVLKPVQACIYLGILDGLGHVFDANDAAGVARHKVCNGARAGIEVIDKFVAGKCGEIPHHLVEFKRLLRIGLVKTLRPNLETQVFHTLIDEVCAGIGDDLKVRYCPQVYSL